MAEPSKGLGLAAFNRLKQLETQANKLGFRFGTSRYSREVDGIALLPLEGRMPLYEKDTEFWFGDADATAAFLKGVEWSTEYFKSLKLVDDAKVARKEQDYRNRLLLKQIKDAGDE